eukprot:TRINITY_DN30544_c0_g1_i1.p1 TRINITY_DN30544_c0_g1~~TRINITY_DN30544_c0_g1_i1.p1  ORF type:complete len:327 (+),score=37.04 TRINITY_DN30544_c0_g1_i1:93-1073(+)
MRADISEDFLTLGSLASFGNNACCMGEKKRWLTTLNGSSSSVQKRSRVRDISRWIATVDGGEEHEQVLNETKRRRKLARTPPLPTPRHNAAAYLQQQCTVKGEQSVTSTLCVNNLSSFLNKPTRIDGSVQLHVVFEGTSHHSLNYCSRWLPTLLYDELSDTFVKNVKNAIQSALLELDRRYRADRENNNGEAVSLAGTVTIDSSIVSFSLGGADAIFCKRDGSVMSCVKSSRPSQGIGFPELYPEFSANAVECDDCSFVFIYTSHLVTPKKQVAAFFLARLFSTTTNVDSEMLASTVREVLCAESQPRDSVSGIFLGLKGFAVNMA